ncbi:MAG: undecaprenyl-diphosphate phosphatase [Sphingomonadales bacterium]|nr:undecaprenyl-diphosphate phosphatase [Sphingomonadales bacterium]
MTWLQAIVVAVVEGLTEFLPVSSTGHMILASAILGIEERGFAETFEIVIQLGAILAVLVLYYRRLLQDTAIYLKLAVAFLPTGVVGLLLYKIIRAYLFNPLTVSISLLVGGALLILLDPKEEGEHKPVGLDLGGLSLFKAFLIGCVQCVSMIPGVSRSAATILGGMGMGLNRLQAAEFSFLLAIPTMFAATGYELYKSHDQITSDQSGILLLGMAVSFAVAWFAVRAFVGWLTRHGMAWFGWYRVGVGIIFLILYLTGASVMQL